MHGYTYIHVCTYAMHKHKLLKWKYINLRNDESKHFCTFTFLLSIAIIKAKLKTMTVAAITFYLKIFKTVETLLKKVSVSTILPISSWTILYKGKWCAVHYLYYLTDLGRLFGNFHTLQGQNFQLACPGILLKINVVYTCCYVSFIIKKSTGPEVVKYKVNTHLIEGRG